MGRPPVDHSSTGGSSGGGGGGLGPVPGARGAADVHMVDPHPLGHARPLPGAPPPLSPVSSLPLPLPFLCPPPIAAGGGHDAHNPFLGEGGCSVAHTPPPPHAHPRWGRSCIGPRSGCPSSRQQLCCEAEAAVRPVDSVPRPPSIMTPRWTGIRRTSRPAMVRTRGVLGGRKTRRLWSSFAISPAFLWTSLNRARVIFQVVLFRRDAGAT